MNEETKVASLALYKVRAKQWDNAEYSAAEDQIKAIENVHRLHTDTDPRECTVEFVATVFVAVPVATPKKKEVEDE